MNRRIYSPETRRQHTIDLLFPLALFFLLAICSVLVLVFSSDLYRRTVQTSQANYDSMTALSYITERVHRNDVSDQISLGDFQGADSLIITETFDGVTYFTYLYVYDGYLRELFVREDTVVSAESGQKILPLQSLQMDEIEPGILHLVSLTANGKQNETYIAIKTDSYL